MYNYYKYLKQQQEEDQHGQSILKEQQQNMAHKNLTNRLVKKYNARISRFAFDMVKHPLVIRDYNNPIKTTRKQFMDEAASKAEGAGRPKFIFSNFISEKQRVKKYLETKNNVNDNNYALQKIEIKQSQAGETINYNTIEGQNFSKKVFYYNQSANEIHTNPNTTQKGKGSQLFSQLIIPTLRTSKSNLKQQKHQKINSKSKKRCKTHFKALTYLAGHYFQNILQDKPSQSETQGSILGQTSQGFYSNQTLVNKPLSSQGKLAMMQNTTPSIQKNKTSSNIFHKYSSRFPLKEDNIDIIESNPLLYNLNIHFNNKNSQYSSNSKENNDNENDNDNKLEYLRSLAFEAENKDGDKERNLFRNESMNLFQKIRNKGFKGSVVSLNNVFKIYKDNDKVIIDNEPIDKKKIDVIAKKILKKCNYVHSKSIYNNTNLKKGEGKMMITGGMTVNDFNSKYLLK